MNTNTNKLPSSIGEVSFLDHGVQIHSAGDKFDPQVYVPNPSAAPTDQEINSAIIPKNEPVIHPLLMVDDQHILPRDYIVHLRSQKCLCCGTTHEWVDVYARNEVPPQHSMGKVVQNLVPVRGFRYNLPVRSVSIQSKPVPACHECIQTDKLTTLMERLPDPRTTEEWQRTIKRKAAQALETANKAKAAKASAKKAPVSLDEALKEFGI
jgi:hypothetical protein